MTTDDEVQPVLLALDWGTSSLRAFLMDAHGVVLRERDSSHGIQNLPEPGVPGFEAAFRALCGDDIARWPHLPVVAGGMVGSAQGWAEAPYITCPADISSLARQAAVVRSGLGPDIRIAPGVLYDPADGTPDVMRGEEIQIAGALARHPELSARACVVLPGTHSKWAFIEDGRIVSFVSYMTGELFAVLSRHSILGRLMPTDGNRETDGAGFSRGLADARKGGPGDLPHQLFATRTLGLTGRLPHAALPDYLSGLLIGQELVSGLAHHARTPGAPLVLIGDGALCRRYRNALAAFEASPAAVLDNTAPTGLFQFAVAAGLIAGQPAHS